LISLCREVENKNPKILKMEKVKSFVGQVLIVTAGALLALKVYDWLNKPKVVLPKTTTTTGG